MQKILKNRAFTRLPYLTQIRKPDIEDVASELFGLF